MSLAVSRVSVLSDLITCGKPVDVLAAIVSDMGWSEAWADLIECREDIDYQSERDEEILEAIYVLANPALNGPLDEALTDQVIASLSA